MVAAPFAAMSLGIETVGGQSVAEGADGATLVIVAAGYPAQFILVVLMASQINDPFDALLVESGKDNVDSKIGVASEDVNVQGGVESVALLDESGDGGRFDGVMNSLHCLLFLA